MITTETGLRRIPAPPASPSFRQRRDGVRDGIRGSRFKLNFINQFIRLNGVADLLEFGCGDGRLMRGLRVGRYLGLDSPGPALEHCQALAAGDLSRRVLPANQLPTGTRAALALSSGMLPRLVSTQEFNAHIRTLFHAARDYVLVSTSQATAPWAEPPHGHDVPEHVRRFFPTWSLAGQAPPPESGTDAAGFLIFARHGLPCQVPLLA